MKCFHEITILLEKSIKECLSQILNKNFDNISLQKTREEFEGHYTLVLFQYLKPTEFQIIGKEIGEWLIKNSDIIVSYKIVGGFLNLSIDSKILLECFLSTKDDNNFGHAKKNGKTLLIEYSSPNTNKPLHLGHLRNNFIGYAISSIFDAAGYDVKQVCLVNDRGVHICKSMVAYKHEGKNKTPQSERVKGDHFVGDYYVLFDKIYKQQITELKEKGFDEEYAKINAPIMLEAQELLKKWEEGDEEVISLWRIMNQWVYEGFNETYKKIGVSFDKVYYESKTYLLGEHIVKDGLDKGIFYKKEDNSIWVNLTDEGLDNKLLLRGNGTSVYITQDLGTADMRYEEVHPDKMIYVVGNEQNYHFDVLKAITKKMIKPYSDAIYHLSYGMVDLPSGKMKSREGTVVDADDIIAEMINKAKEKTEELGKTFDQDLYETIGLGALKYYLLKVNSQKRIMFDPNKSINFHGDTASFIQYSYVRIQSILRKNELFKNGQIDNVFDLEDIEEKLIFEILDYPNRIKESAKEYDPSIIAQYVLNLARCFSKMYEALPISKEEDNDKKNVRLLICSITGYVIKDVFKILGIKVPEKM